MYEDGNRSQLLKRILVHGIGKGWRDSNRSLTKTTIKAKILLNQTARMLQKSQALLESNEVFEKEYESYVDTFQLSSDFGRDPGTCLIPSRSSRSNIGFGANNKIFTLGTKISEVSL